MENIQILRQCPWISDTIEVKKYFDEYNKILDEANGMKMHNEKFDYDNSLQEFFINPDDVEGPLSSRSSPQYIQTRPSSMELIDPKIKKTDKSPEIVEECETRNDPFNLDKMENDCSVDLLTVNGELPSRELCKENPIEKETGRITNWFTGSYMDGVIPDGGSEKLVTLSHQAQELYKRETVKDYTRLRHRLLKYSSTVRMVMKKENCPEVVTLQEDLSDDCIRDLIFNIRIHRPFYKWTYSKKGKSRFPKHSQELLMMGSQKLSELRDVIYCINDSSINHDISEMQEKDYSSSFPSMETTFPSAFFYFDGFFYNDEPYSQDISTTIKEWTKKYPLIGPLASKSMKEATLSELNVRLGYPYVYQHLGNCEHLIVITDIRLAHRTDIQDPSRYPLSRGNPIMLSYKCYSCQLYLASYIIKDDPRLPIPIAHFCKKCIETYCYDSNRRKIRKFKMFPFIDEFAAKTKKESKKSDPTRRIEIAIESDKGVSSQLIIEPLNEGV